MARPNLGKSARRKVIAVRVTDAEEAALIRKYGSATKALRILIDADKAKDKDAPS